MYSFLLALQLLTIIPVSHSFIASDKQLGYSSLYYPIIGLLIGSILAIIALLLNSLPTQIQATVVLIVWVVLTGGLHLDGLADCADAWVGGLSSKQRTLDIMKDPASGPIAVVVLILVLLLKWSIVSHLLAQQALYILILTPMLGRLAILLLMLFTNYIRTGGMAEKQVKNLPKATAYRLCFIFLLPATYYLGYIAIGFMLLILLLIASQAKKRLGGVTGDVYGAATELVEVSVLLGAII